MKYLNQYLTLGIIALLGSSRIFSTHYDDLKTKELSQYLNEVVEDFKYDHINCITKTRIRPGISISSAQIKELVMQGADPNIRARRSSSTGYSALHIAAEAGDIDLIDFLVNYCANINMDDGSPYCRTPLMIVAACGHREAVVKLIGFGAYPRPNSTAHKETKEILLTYNQHEKAIPGQPWFQGIIRNGNNDALKNILTHYPPSLIPLLVNQFDVFGQTSLDIALVTRNEEAIRLLLSYGADPLLSLYALSLPRRVREWQKPFKLEEGILPSIYEQINTEAAYHSFLRLRLLTIDLEGLPGELFGFIYTIQLLLLTG